MSAVRGVGRRGAGWGGGAGGMRADALQPVNIVSIEITEMTQRERGGDLLVCRED